MWRQLSSISLKELHFRDTRPYILGENYQFIPNETLPESKDVEGSGYGTLKLTGYLRGQSLNVNQLIHIPGWGDFQMSQIDSSDDPYKIDVIIRALLTLK